MSAIGWDYLDKLRDSVRALTISALREDLPHGDVTAETLGLGGREARAEIISREDVVMCGAAWYEEVLKVFRDRFSAATLGITCLAKDGFAAAAGSALFELEGDMAAIVAIERTLLNFLTRAIGIARATRRFVRAIEGYPRIRIFDTRKTLPGYRFFDKYAVLQGGGHNHRFSLSDQVLIKENHLSRLGSVTETLNHVKADLQQEIQVQIEVRDLAELDEALAYGCSAIMLDNFTPEMVHRACERDRKETQLEVSGGVTLANIKAFCHPKLDRISIGALTHSVTAPDLSLLIREEGV